MKSIQLFKPNQIWIALSLCMLNLLFMHYHIIIVSERSFPPFCYIDNLFGILADISIVCLSTFYISGKRIKTAITMTFVISFLWSLCNVEYSRFFRHYITLSAIGQIGGLFGNGMMDSIIAGIQWCDMFYIICLALFYHVIRKDWFVVSIPYRLIRNVMAMVCIMWGLMACYYGNISTAFPLFDTQAFTFRRGCVMPLLNEVLLDLKGVIELSPAQIEEIEREKNKGKETCSDSIHLKKENVFFILVESYMSFTSDMIVMGREVTPFLNSLKRDSLVYYNGKMRENVTIGESSDGQFIYMTGLLPLRSLITVSRGRDIILPGIPKVLDIKSRMVIPTNSNMWLQDDMCHQYGFENLTSSEDYNVTKSQYLNDEQVFQLAIQKDKESTSPFFSVILTMSMHQPYTKQIDPAFLITDSSIPKDLACYLNACHYTDLQIERYFEHLKRTGLYDNSLIVIAADHPVHNTDFGGVSKDIPLYIVNVPSDVRENMWQGEFNQIDVYTTLLDLLGVESDWYGLGRSLLSPNYSNSIDSKKWDVSEWIIRGDYFSIKTHI